MEKMLTRMQAVKECSGESMTRRYFAVVDRHFLLGYKLFLAFVDTLFLLSFMIIVTVAVYMLLIFH